MAKTLKSVWLCAAATAALTPGIALAQTPARPLPPPNSTSASQTPPSDPGGTVPPSSPPAPASLPVGTTAQSTPPDATTGTVDTQAEAPVDESTGADIVVTGIRRSLEQAIDLKRDAITIRDSIVAEDIGRFPEANIAESLQRIPGVELQRDGASNEGSTIQLRGLPNTFTVTTFNGSPVYTTSGGGIGNAARTFNYDVFPSELFGRADVYKAPLAELNEGGIAGVIDLRTPRPFDQKEELTVRYALSVNNNSQSGKNNPRGNALISARSGNFGALLAVAAARTVNGRAGFDSTGTYSASETNAADRAAGAIPSPIAGRGVPPNIIYDVGNRFNYNFTVPGINLNGFTQQQIRDAILPRSFNVFAANNKRERLGIAGSLQFKNDRLDVSIDGLYSVVRDSDRNSDIRWPIRDSFNATPVTAFNQLALVPLNVGVDANNNLQGTLGNVQFTSNSAFARTETRYRYLALNAAYKVTDRLTVSAQAAMSRSRGERETVGLLLDARTAGQTVTFDTTNPIFPTITTTADLLNPSNYFAFGTSAANGTVLTGGPANSVGYREEQDRLKSGRFVVDWEWELRGIEGALKAGVQYNQNKKINEVRALSNTLYNDLVIPGVGRYTSATLAQRNAFITSFLRPLDTTDFVPGAPSTLPEQFLAFTPDFAFNTLNGASAARASALNAGQTYTATETIKAAFIQSDFTFDVFGRRVRLNTGVRYVDTATDIDNNVVVNGEFLPKNLKGGYTSWLPSATIALDITDKLIARGATGRTFTRAAIQSIAASLSLPQGGAGNLLLNAGNPDLKPEFSKSLDGSLEWYFAKGGILSIAYYKKTLTGRAANVVTSIPFNELGIPSSIFTANIVAQLAADPTTPVEVRTPVNLDRYSLNGIEVAYQQQFNFLPAPFDGLGLIASFTRVNTQGLRRLYPQREVAGITRPLSLDASLPSRNPLLPNVFVDLNDVPDITYQIAGLYEKGKVALRVTYNWKDEVATLNQGSLQDIGFQRVANARGYLDATIAYKFQPWLELRVDATNITNTKTFDFFRNVNGLYGDEQSRVTGANQNGRIITVGIRGSF